MPRNVFRDLRVEVPREGDVSLGEINTRIYSHGSDSEQKSHLPMYPMIECKTNRAALPTSRSLLVSSSSIVERVSQKLQEATPPVSPLPPRSAKPIAAAEGSWFEKIRQWSTWYLYHVGISHHRPYEHHPLPLSLSVASTATIRCIAVHPHTQRLAVALKDHSVHIYSLENEEWKETLVLTHQFQKNVLCMEWKPLGGSMLAIGCPTGVLVWEGDWMTRYLTCPSISNVCSLQWSPTEPIIAVGCPHESVVIWDVSTEVPTRLQSVGPSSSYLLRWSPNGHYLFQACLNGSFNIWETMTWTRENWNIPDGRLVQTVAWSADSHYLAYALDGKSEIVCLVFDHVVPSISAQFCQKIPLTQYSFESSRESLVCGRISQIEWNLSGDRLMVSFCSHKSNNSAIALFATSLSPSLSISPIGFLRTSQDCSSGILLKFCNHPDGALALIAASGLISTMKLLFHRSDPSEHKHQNSLFQH